MSDVFTIVQGYQYTGDDLDLSGPDFWGLALDTVGSSTWWRRRGAVTASVWPGSGAAGLRPGGGVRRRPARACQSVRRRGFRRGR